MVGHMEMSTKQQILTMKPRSGATRSSISVWILTDFQALQHNFVFKIVLSCEFVKSVRMDLETFFFSDMKRALK